MLSKKWKTLRQIETDIRIIRNCTFGRAEKRKTSCSINLACGQKPNIYSKIVTAAASSAATATTNSWLYPWLVAAAATKLTPDQKECLFFKVFLSPSTAHVLLVNSCSNFTFRISLKSGACLSWLYYTYLIDRSGMCLIEDNVSIGEKFARLTNIFMIMIVKECFEDHPQHKIIFPYSANVFSLSSWTVVVIGFFH